MAPRHKSRSSFTGLAGGLATVLHDSVMNPAEVVKQRMQMYASPYKNCVQCFLHVWRVEGTQAFYRSFTTQLTMNIPFQCVHFVTYEFLQEVSDVHFHFAGYSS